jgi:RNA recognition motif-containing protein
MAKIFKNNFLQIIVLLIIILLIAVLLLLFSKKNIPENFMNIYAGNLSRNITSEDLENLFTPFGAVASAKIIKDKFNNNRSKGFGFVEMANDDEARAAISQLHDTEVLGRNILVNESKPKESRPPPRSGGRGSSGGGYGGGGGGSSNRIGGFGSGGGGYGGGGGN